MRLQLTFVDFCHKYGTVLHCMWLLIRNDNMQKYAYEEINSTFQARKKGL